MSKQQYELLKWYPSLPDWVEKGDVAEEISNKSYTRYSYLINKQEGQVLLEEKLTEKEVINNPEFWEKVEQKNYEILSVKKDKTGHIYDKCEGSLDKKLQTNHYSIFSVRRLPDDECFTVGDKVKHWETSITGYNKWLINSFRVKNGKLVACSGTGFYMELSEITKREDPIFVTDDGVDIYKGDEYWFVTDLLDRVHYVNTECSPGADSCLHHTFSTKEKAEEYIEEHKPRYSKADIERSLNKAKTDGRVESTLIMHTSTFRRELDK